MKAQNKTVLITGGARGLGLVFANFYAQSGANVAICSRTEMDLDQAELQLRKAFPTIRFKAYLCDVSVRDEVDAMIKAVHEQFGRIDILVNNAGVIQSAPIEVTGEDDFRKSIDSNLWAMIHTTLAVTPIMMAQKAGKILNVTSIGGVLPVPHLASYSTAKFGAVGFSVAMAMGLRKFGITVTTAMPGLMRTGSFYHAHFKGNHESEMRWFTKASTLPLLTLPVEKAAKAMIKACDRGQAFYMVGWNAKLGRIAFALWPNLFISAMRWVEKILPAAPLTQEAGVSKSGLRVQLQTGVHPQTEVGEASAEKWNEIR